jgi:hypothetical protein
VLRLAGAPRRWTGSLPSSSIRLAPAAGERRPVVGHRRMRLPGLVDLREIAPTDGPI